MVTTSNWQEMRLGDVVQIKHGWPFKSECFCEWSPGFPVVVNIGNFQYTGGFRFETTQLKGYRGEYPKEYNLSPGDILLVMTCQTSGGEILGIPGRIPDDGVRYLHNQRMGKVVVTRPDLVDLEYLYWIFLWSEFNQELVASSSGTKIVHTAPTRIEAFRFSCPPLELQRSIARILRALNDKIDLNRRMNRTLEAMARALFRSWFVDFEPVSSKREGRKPIGMDDATAALFPEHFQETNMGPIPVGWAYQAVETVSDVGIGKTPPRKEPAWFSTHQGDVRWVSIRDMGDEGLFVLDSSEYLVPSAVTKFNVRVVPDNTVLLSFKLTIGRVAITDGEMTTNEAIAHFKLSDDAPVTTEYLYLYMKEFDWGQLGSTSSIAEAVNSKIIKSMPVMVPGTEVVRAFSKRTSKLFERIRNNQHQAHSLSALRDILLPQLLSGELSGKQAEEMIP